MADNFAAGVSGLAKALIPMKQSTKAIQVQAAKYKIMSKVMGESLDIWMSLKQFLTGVSELFGITSESVEDTGKSVKKLNDDMSLLMMMFQAIKMSMIFLIGIFALVSTALVLFTGSIGGATAAFPEFFAGFESIKDSILEVIGHLQTIGATILALDWSPLVDVATIAIGSIILLIVGFYDLAFSIIAMVIGEFAKLFTYLEESGAFQTIIVGVAEIATAFLLAFGYIFEILDAFGINFGGVFALVSGIWITFVDALINSGILLFFADLIGYIGAILPPIVIVVGEILVLTAKILAFFLGPIAVGIASVVNILFQLFVGTIAIIVSVFRVAFAVLGGIGKIWMAIFTGDFRAIPGLILAIFSDVIGIAGDLLDSLIAIFINIGKAILAPFEVLWDNITDLMTPIYDAIKDPIVNAISGAMDAIISIVDTSFAVIKVIIDIFVALFTGDWATILGTVGLTFTDIIDIATNLLDSLTTIFTDIGNTILAPFESLIEGVTDLMSPVYNAVTDPIMDAVDDVMGPIQDLLDNIDKVSIEGITGGASSMLGKLNPFSSGGISSGPRSGYPVALHGTEAIVPLPDGRTIPVTVKGMGGGGGDNITVNIAVKGGGNAKDIAKAVSREVSRTFRNRSRGGSYSRGV